MAGERARRGVGAASRAARRGAVAVLLLAALTAGCSDLPTIDGAAPAWDPTLSATDSAGVTHQVVYHWPIAYSIAIFVDTTATTPGYELQPALEHAMAMWQDATWYREVAWHLAASPAQADVILHNAAAPMLVGTGDCSYTSGDFGGDTFICASPALDSMETLPLVSGGPGHVKIDVSINGDRAGSADEFRTLVAHEMGHVLGIGLHSDTTTDLMNGYPTAPAPTSRDAATLRWVLHQPVTLRP